MFEPEELMARIVDLEAQLKVSEMAPPAAEQLIACLEGEIAKRDARIVELEECLPDAIDVIERLRAELAAIKAQEPVWPRDLDLASALLRADREMALGSCARDLFYFALIECLQANKLYAAPVVNRKLTTECKRCSGTARVDIGTVCDNWVDCPECAAPVSEAKAQGVVQWPEADEIMQMAFEEGQPADDASGYCFELEEFDLFIERLMSEVAHLNAAPAPGGE